MTSAPIGAPTGDKVKTGAIEDTPSDASATTFCTTIVESFRNTKQSALPFAGEVVVAIVVATSRCTWVATITQSAGL